MSARNTVLSVALMAAFAVPYANASTVASDVSAFPAGKTARIANALSANLFLHRTFAGDPDTFQFASIPGRWVTEFTPQRRGGNPLFHRVFLSPSFASGSNPKVIASPGVGRGGDDPAVAVVMAGERANPILRLRMSDVVMTSSYASTEPLTLKDIDSRSAGDAIFMQTTGPVLTRMKDQLRSANYREPNAYAMLLAGLGLIGCVTRQRMRQD